MESFFITTVSVIFSLLALLCGFYCYSAFAQSSDRPSSDDYGILTIIGIVAGGLCIICTIIAAFGIMTLVTILSRGN